MKSVKIGGLNVDIKGIELDFGLKIDSFEIKTGPANADIDPLKVRLDTPGTAKAIVTEQGIADFLEVKSPGNISNFSVKISGGQIYVSASANIVITLPVKAVCSLEIVDQNKLFVRLDSVDVMGGKAKGIVESQLEKVNPILDASDLPINVAFTSVEVDAGLVTLHGEVR